MRPLGEHSKHSAVSSRLVGVLLRLSTATDVAFAGPADWLYGILTLNTATTQSQSLHWRPLRL